MNEAIRPARPEEVAEIEKLLVASDLTPVEVAASIERFLVADKRGIVGVIGSEYGGESVLIRSVAVASEFKKNGIATALLDAALSRAKAVGSTTAYLFSNTAIDYFAKRGFQQIERSEVPLTFLNSPAVSVCCGSAIAMRLELS